MTSDGGGAASFDNSSNMFQQEKVKTPVAMEVAPPLLEEDLGEEENGEQDPMTVGPSIGSNAGVVMQDEENPESLRNQDSRDDDDENEQKRGEQSTKNGADSNMADSNSSNDNHHDETKEDACHEAAQSPQFVKEEEEDREEKEKQPPSASCISIQIDNNVIEDNMNSSNSLLSSGEDGTAKNTAGEANAAQQTLLTTTSSDLSESAKTSSRSSSSGPLLPSRVPASASITVEEDTNNNPQQESPKNLAATLSQESVALPLPESVSKTTTNPMEMDVSSSDFVVSATKTPPPPPPTTTNEEITEVAEIDDDKDTTTTTTNINSTENVNGGEGGGGGGEHEEWDEMLNEDDIEEEELKAAQSTDNQETAANSSVTDDQTIRTEDAGTDTTSDTEDSISTALEEDDEEAAILENDNSVQDDNDNGDVDDDVNNGEHHHAIMPRQPEILITHEEEKTEVDEYPLGILQEEKRSDDDVKDILASLPPEPPNVELPLLPRSHHHRIDDDDDYDDDEAKHSVPPVIENKRAEYVSVTVLKVEATMEHGLEFMMVNRELRVSHIRPTGMFANTPLAPFDKMLRINDLNIETLDPVNASHLLDVLTGSVTVIAQNPGGVADLVESQITKPLPESRTGLYLQDSCIDENLHKNRTEIARIASNSLFSSALLHVSDEVIAVNGCTDLDQNTGDLLLSTAPKICVVLARTKLKTQMAIARRPTHQLPPGFNFVRAMEEARRQREELRRKQGCYYNSCERPGACANLFQWLGNLFVITVALVALSMNWQSIKDEASDGSDAVRTILKFAGLFVGGILLGFLVNAPWWFRIVGARFSIAQLVCNIIVIASYFLFFLFYDSVDGAEDEYQLVIFFTLLFPLIVFVNLPTIFPKMEDGSDGNTICDAPSEDEMSTNSAGTDMV